MTETTDSAQYLLGAVRELTVNSEEIERRIAALLEDESEEQPIITSRHVAHAMRNVGKRAGAEIAVGKPTEPLRGFKSWRADR